MVLMYHKQDPTSPSRRAFTLVEMLVSVALVLMMMTMFAQIFSVASTTVSTQRVIAENDQKARTVSTVIRGDVTKRSFTLALPFHPDEDSATSPTPFGNRAGYLYINTNDPSSYSDDILQFTVDSRLQSVKADTTPYTGRAATLSVPMWLAPNQPDVDGGSLTPDYSSSSPAAQIAYFLRNGNLYRRVVLIRNPIPLAGQELDEQPSDSAGNNFFSSIGGGLFEVHGANNPYPPATGQDRYNDFELFFDFSAIADPTSLTAKFLGTKALSNELSSAGAANEAFGNPRFRYGFNQFTGQSREYTRLGDSTILSDLASRAFMGRFTLAETSTLAFNWPQAPSTIERRSDQQWNQPDLGPIGNGNPLDVDNTPLTLDLSSGLVREFNGKDDADSSDPLTVGLGGPRQQEDLLLANVQEMRVEIWDSRIGRFVTPGYGSLDDGDSLVGDYHIRRNLQIGPGRVFFYGPLAPYRPATPRASDRQPHIFDTWHPNVDVDYNNNGNLEIFERLPPYIPYRYSPPRRNATPPGPSSPEMPLDTYQDVNGSLANESYWLPNRSYDVGDVVFPQWKDAIPLGGNGDNQFTFDEIDEPKFSIAYRCIKAGTSSSTGPSSSNAGQRISDGTVVWESFDNRVPLTTIRMTLRYINETTGDPRQVTLVLPMAN